MRPTILTVVNGVHMGLGHLGLSKIIKRLGIDVKKLKPGDVIMCLNSKGDKLKVIGMNGLVIGYLKMPGGHKIVKEALQYIPRTFGSTGFDYDSAVRTVLEKKFKDKMIRGPLETARAEKSAGLLT